MGDLFLSSLGQEPWCRFAPSLPSYNTYTTVYILAKPYSTKASEYLSPITIRTYTLQTALQVKLNQLN